MTHLSVIPGGSGEQQAFAALVGPHYATLFRVAYRFTGSRSDAEDLVQETCVRAYRNREKLSGLDDPRGWMICVMRRVFIDQTRRYDRSHVSSLDASGVEDVLSDRPGPAEQTEADMMATRIERNLRKLSKEHRTLLALHDMEGYSLAELEEITGIKIGTIKSRLHRARVKLGRLLQSDGELVPSHGRMRIRR